MILFIFVWLCFLQSFSFLQSNVTSFFDEHILFKSDGLFNDEINQCKMYSLNNKPLAKAHDIQQCLMGIRNNYLVDQFLVPEVIDWIDSKGRTLLHHAMYWNRGLIVAILCSLGADVNAQDIFGDSPLHIGLRANQQSTYNNFIGVCLFSQTTNFIFRSRVDALLFPFYKNHFFMNMNKGDIFEEDDNVAYALILSSINFLCLPNYCGESPLSFFTTSCLRDFLEDAFSIRAIALRNAIVLELIKRKKKESF